MGKEFTKEELLDAAREAGLVASPRLLRAWVQAGLIDRPARKSRGRAKGVVGYYSENQRILFLALLRNRQAGASLKQLANLPVWLWLRFGDEYVPLRQVRGALVTWRKAVVSAGWTKADLSAAHVTKLLSAPGARQGRQRWLRSVLADIPADLDVDVGELVDAARGVIDPGRTGIPLGPEGAQLFPEGYSELVVARLEALNGIREFSPRPFSDEEFMSARSAYRRTTADYQQNVQEFQADSEIGDIFETPSVEGKMNSACQNLTMLLGLLRRNSGEKPRKLPRTRR
ncbi:MAG: helix-turn-helix domain-containing protein [Chloroflexota bacterium]|nr:helix-turn-helix domain-containing protein [Chloroflexota bacterium]